MFLQNNKFSFACFWWGGSRAIRTACFSKCLVRPTLNLERRTSHRHFQCAWCCFISKSYCLKVELGRKSRHWHLCKLMQGLVVCVSQCFTFSVGPNRWRNLLLCTFDKASHRHSQSAFYTLYVSLIENSWPAVLKFVKIYEFYHFFVNSLQFLKIVEWA